MKRGLMVFMLWILPEVAIAQDLPIQNFLRVNAEFCTAGQPTIDQLSDLKEDGIRSVLNLRVPDEHDAAAEQAQVLELGMKYFNIPIAGADIRNEQVDEFLALSDDTENQPMFIHCGSANRVGALWMIRRVLRDGWTREAAETEAAEVGLRSAALKDFALRYLEAHRTQ
jgi:uncharacterized protein (TIGR01244 family)